MVIYNFIFEGGRLDGEAVLTDSAQPESATSQAAQWIDCTLGGAVGLNLLVLSPDLLELPVEGTDTKDREIEVQNQIYRVVYRDQHAGTVIVRCQHVPWIELIPREARRIVFTFEGGFKDGAKEICALVEGDKHRECREAVARFYVTESGTIGKRFGEGSIATLRMLKEEGLEATRNIGRALHIYEVVSRIDDGEDLRIHCKFVTNA